MMKKVLYGLSMFFLLIGCSRDNSNEEDVTADLRIGDVDEFCYETNLIAGQHIDVGELQIVYLAGEILVKYVTTDGWELQEMHLFVGECDDMPINGGGNPKVGKFPLHGNPSSGTTEYAFHLNPQDYPECACIAAHAVVKKPGNGTETAWAEGMEFPGNNWSMYFEYCLDYCDGD